MKIDQLKAGVIFSYVNLLLSCAFSIVLTPMMLRVMGNSEYGLYQLIGSFVSNMTILDFGLSNTITRYVSKFRQQQNKKMEKDLLSLVIRFYVVIVCGVIICGVVTYYNVDNIFGASLTMNELGKAKIMLIILAFNMMISLPGNVYGCILCAYERFAFYHGITIVKFLVRAAVIVVLLLNNQGAIALVIVDTLLNMCIVVAHWLMCKNGLHIKIRLNKPNRTLQHEILTYSVYIFLTYVTTQIIWKVNQTIIGMKMSTSAVAIYAVGVSFSSVFLSLSTGISGVFISRITKLTTGDYSLNDLTLYMAKVGRIQEIILLYIYFGFILLGKPFIELWVGQGYDGAWSTAVLVMTGILLQGVESIGLTILQAINRHRFYTIANFIICVINIAVTFVLIDYMGINGAALATMVAILVGQGVLVNWYFHFRVGMDMRLFFKKLTKKILPASLIAFGSALVAVKFIGADSWASFITCGAIFTFFYCIGIWWAANESERDILFDFLKSVKKLVHFE